jgi:methionyl aminopeptidase
MKINNNTPFVNSSLITIQDQKWLDNARIAGRIAAEAINKLKFYVENKTFHSMATLNDLIERFIENESGMPTFKNYKGFPSGVCISVNEQLVHGIPTDIVLANGDIVSFDLGCTYNGSIADTATTLIFGQPKSNEHTKLVQATEEALVKAIQSIRIGKRLGVIGYTINKVAKQYGYSVVSSYGGHGISMTSNNIGVPHAAPFINNVSELNENVRAEVGMVIAIEPLFVLGSSNKTKVSEDNWTVVCDNLCSHSEHTLYLHEDHIEIISWRNNETYLKSNKVYYAQKIN